MTDTPTTAPPLLSEPRTQFDKKLRQLAEAAMSVTQHDSGRDEPEYVHAVQAMETMGRVSPNVVIITDRELQEIEDAAFQRGVARGRSEERLDRSTEVARNCANWKDGVCQRCGVQWQDCQVSADFYCPHFVPRGSTSPPAKDQQ
jgi:hypothetical protein